MYKCIIKKRDSGFCSAVQYVTSGLLKWMILNLNSMIQYHCIRITILRGDGLSVYDTFYYIDYIVIISKKKLM